MVSKFSGDGSFSLSRLLEQINADLKGERGKRAKLQKKVSRSGEAYLCVVYSHPSQRQKNGKRKQINASIGKFSYKTLRRGESIAHSISSLLSSNSYTDELADRLFNRPASAASVSANSNKLTFDRLYQLAMTEYANKKKRYKNPRSMYIHHYKFFESYQGKLEPFTPQSLRELIETFPETHRKKYHLNRLNKLLVRLNADPQFLSLCQQLKEDTHPKQARVQRVPDDREIVSAYLQARECKSYNPEVIAQRQRYLRLYGILAIFGLRIHEAFYILNWDTPVAIKNNEFVSLAAPDDQADRPLEQIGEILVPAITDPENRMRLLIIGDGKTGKRIAMPSVPKGADWFKEFDLLHSYYEVVPQFKNPFQVFPQNGHYACTHYVCQWFYKNINFFTAHKLRHACNIRLHSQEHNGLAIANSLGHTMLTNQSTYLKLQSVISKALGIKQNLDRLEFKSQQLEQLKAINERLEAERDYYRDKYIETKTELEMIKAAMGK